MNNVVLIGRLARDPEVSYTTNTQTAVCRFTLAVDRPKKNGEDQGADFIRIVVWGKQGEACGRYLGRGRQVAIRGRIETGSYTDSRGEKVYTTEVVADGFNGVEFLGSGNAGSESSGATRTSGNDNRNSSRQPKPQPVQESFDNYGYDDLPGSPQDYEDDEPF